MDRMILIRLSALLLPLLFALPLCGQLTTSSISGYVFDPSGQPIAKAEITAMDPRRSLAKQTVSDDSGAYRLAGLPPASYTVSVAANGFAVSKQENITVAVDSQLRLDFHLVIARVLQSVDVTAPEPLLQKESAELGTVLDQKWIENAPLNRRDFLQMALLLPGIQPPVEGSELSTRGSFAMHANGGREEYNNFLLDGVDNNDPYTNRYVVQPSVDSIQEFKTLTNSYSAEYGRSAGGQVNVITRRGTNSFHGSIYEYLRNRVLDAHNFFDSAGKPSFIRNEFGFNLGGPVVRSRTFFFAATDFLRGRQGLLRLATVPTEAQRIGDLSGLGVTIRDPFTGLPFSGNVIPPGRISPLSRHVLDLFPPANRPGTGGNFIQEGQQRENQTQGNFRLDHRMSDSSDIALRYSFGMTDLFEPYAEDTGTVLGFGDFVTDATHHASVQYQRAFGPRILNFLRLGFNRFSRDLLPENFNTNVGQAWQVGWLDVQARAFGYPTMNVAGFSKVGDAFSLPIHRHTNTYQVSDSASIDRTPHLLKIGGEVRHAQLNGTLDLFARGSLSFSGFISGSGISDLLLGLPSFGMRSDSDNPMTMRTTAYNFYVEDTWRVARNLTLNLGLRYEYNSPVTDPHDGMSALNLQTDEIVQVGTNGVPRSGLRPDWNNLAPRIGLAWNPVATMVLRGGYGVYYDSGMFTVNSAQYFNPPQFNLRLYFPSATNPLTLGDPFPLGAGITPPPSLNVLSPNLVTSYLQHWNLALEKAFHPLGTFSVSYSGSKGTRLIRALDLNQPAPGAGNVQLRRPHPEYGSIFFAESTGCSSFHSLQASFLRRLSSRVFLWTAYTLSRSIDDASAFLETGPDRNFPQDSRNLKSERGYSSFDIRHRLVVFFRYELPRGSAWTRDTEFRGITILQSGQPFTPVLRFDNSNTGNNGGTTGSDRPNLVGDSHIPNPSPEQWFNTSAFAIPEPFTFGNAGRNILRGPGYASIDVSLLRRFRLGESATLSAEAQAFNLFNRTNFNLPELYADEPATFGKIFAAKAPRQLQFSVRLSF